VDGTQVQVPRNKWWDVDCRRAIEDKNKAKQRLLQCRTRITCEQRNEANRVYRNKKKKWLNDRILQIEENHRTNGTRKFFNNFRFMGTHNSALPRMCRDADGNLVVHQAPVLGRWNEYFIKMFTVAETDQISDIMDDLVGDNDLYIGTANVQ
jgi:hypothetical protein